MSSYSKYSAPMELRKMCFAWLLQIFRSYGAIEIAPVLTREDDDEIKESHINCPGSTRIKC